MCVHNENCVFMRTYIPCYIGSEEKVSSKKKNKEKKRKEKKKNIVKHDLIKETLTFSRCSLSFYFSLFVRQVLSYIIKKVKSSDKIN